MKSRKDFTDTIEFTLLNNLVTFASFSSSTPIRPLILFITIVLLILLALFAMATEPLKTVTGYVLLALIGLSTIYFGLLLITKSNLFTSENYALRMRELEAARLGDDKVLPSVIEAEIVSTVNVQPDNSKIAVKSASPALVSSEKTRTEKPVEGVTKS